jgi:hypothetical protein
MTYLNISSPAAHIADLIPVLRARLGNKDSCQQNFVHMFRDGKFGKFTFDDVPSPATATATATATAAMAARSGG